MIKSAYVLSNKDNKDDHENLVTIHRKSNIRQVYLLRRFRGYQLWLWFLPKRRRLITALWRSRPDDRMSERSRSQPWRALRECVNSCVCGVRKGRLGSRTRGNRRGDPLGRGYPRRRWYVTIPAHAVRISRGHLSWAAARRSRGGFGEG